MTQRSRDRILANLESIYRDAYDRAEKAGDKQRTLDLDAAYQREQLLLEVLMDIRDAVRVDAKIPGGTGALEKLAALRRLAQK